MDSIASLLRDVDRVVAKRKFKLIEIGISNRWYSLPTFSLHALEFDKTKKILWMDTQDTRITTSFLTPKSLRLLKAAMTSMQNGIYPRANRIL